MLVACGVAGGSCGASVDACGAGGAAGSAGSVACRPGAGMILSAVVFALSSSGESGVSEKLNIVEPIDNSDAVFVVAVLSRQLFCLWYLFLGCSHVVDLCQRKWTSLAGVSCE